MTKVVVSFTGNNGQGTISVPGLKVGDRILSALFMTAGTSFGIECMTFFSTFVVTDGELIQTTAGNESVNTFTALFERDVIIS